jgi:serine/threonine protein kinase
MLQPGDLLQNRYRIGKMLGRGGMGMVYRARDGNLECDVAVKQAFFDDDHLRRAFEREAKLLRRLTHANLPKVTDLFTEGNVQYLVMDFIAGKDLHALLAERGGRIGLAEALGWADQILDALEYLHEQEPPVIHRDIKPANLKLTEKGKLYLLDFGLAKGFHTQAPGSVAGYTPGYAPIEQMQNAGTDARSDIYAVGATLYHLLTGTPPPDAMVRAMNLLRGQADPLRPAHEVNPKIPAGVSAVLEQATAMYCDGRPATAAEMRKELLDAVLTVKSGPMKSTPLHTLVDKLRAVVHGVTSRPVESAPMHPGASADSFIYAPPTAVQRGSGKSDGASGPGSQSNQDSSRPESPKLESHPFPNQAASQPVHTELSPETYLGAAPPPRFVRKIPRGTLAGHYPHRSAKNSVS